MQTRKQVTEAVFGAGPVVVTLLVAALVAGLGLGAFAFAGRDSHPSVGAAQISSDGSVCVVSLVNHGSTDLHLDSVLLSAGEGEKAVSFASGFTLPKNSTSEYDCRLGAQTQFIPPLGAREGGRFNLTARLDDGTQMRFASEFA